MKLFLTSGGLTTETLRAEFRALLPSDARVAFVSTAAIPYRDASWLKDDIGNVQAADVHVSVVDISSVAQTEWRRTFEAADALCFGGGNTYFLLDWVRRSGLAPMLPELLKTRIYVGISAGSMIAGPSIESNSPIFPEEDEGKINDLKGLSFVPFAVVPHLNSTFFTHARAEHIQRFAAGVSYPVYALDDQSAVAVVNGKTRVFSTGEYRVYND